MTNQLTYSLVRETEDLVAIESKFGILSGSVESSYGNVINESDNSMPNFIIERGVAGCDQVDDLKLNCEEKRLKAICC